MAITFWPYSSGGEDGSDKRTIEVRDPTVNDDSTQGYSTWSLWGNSATSEVYRCLDATAGAAVWVQTTLTVDELGSAAMAETSDFDAAGAAAAAQAYAIQRANHTGTQPLSTISDAGTAAAADVTDFATAAQGALAYTALQPSNIGTASGELIGTDEANNYYGLQYKPSVAPTLSSDFCANEHKRYEQYGPEPKTILQQWDVARNSTATYFDANGVLQTAGANEPRIDYDPATGECRGLLVEGQATRLNTIAASPTAPENVTVTAVAHVVSFYGTGSVVLSGVATGAINGTGENDRVYLSVTPTAGTLTLTPSGTVTNLQLETGTIPTSVILGEGTAVIRVACQVTPT